MQVILLKKQQQSEASSSNLSSKTSPTSKDSTPPPSPTHSTEPETSIPTSTMEDHGGNQYPLVLPPE